MSLQLKSNMQLAERTNAVYTAQNGDLAKIGGNSFFCLCGQKAMAEDITRCAEHRHLRDISRFFSAPPEDETSKHKRLQTAITNRRRTDEAFMKSIDREPRASQMPPTVKQQAAAVRSADTIKTWLGLRIEANE